MAVKTGFPGINLPIGRTDWVSTRKGIGTMSEVLLHTMRVPETKNTAPQTGLLNPS